MSVPGGKQSELSCDGGAPGSFSPEVTVAKVEKMRSDGIGVQTARGLRPQ